MRKCKGFAVAYGLYMDYWTCVLAKLKKLLPPTPSKLVEGFWPQDDWMGLSVVGTCLFLLPEDVTTKDEEPKAYCGPTNLKPEGP